MKEGEHDYGHLQLTFGFSAGKGEVAMKGRVVLIATLLGVLTGCETYTWPLGYSNFSITDAKQGQDCRVLVFGLGGMADVTGTQAIRQGGITKLRSAEYRVNTFEGVGTECVVAHGG